MSNSLNLLAVHHDPHALHCYKHLAIYHMVNLNNARSDYNPYQLNILPLGILPKMVLLDMFDNQDSLFFLSIHIVRSRFHTFQSFGYPYILHPLYAKGITYDL